MRVELKSEKNRPAYVRYKLHVLNELCIPKPPACEINRLLDTSKTSIVAVDAYFRGIISEFFKDE